MTCCCCCCCCYSLLFEKKKKKKTLPLTFFTVSLILQDHPDPNGEQLKVLCKVFKRLMSGKIDRIDMEPFHSIMYKHYFTTRREDWIQMLNRAYVWMDWFSIPQTTVPTINETDNIVELKSDKVLAIKSIPAYVERSDIFLILAPGCSHLERKMSTCFRTWRRRGWCLLELYAATMARDSSSPPLLVSSERGKPMYISSLEIMKLSIGESEFSCCQRNHVASTDTHKAMLSSNKTELMSCDKKVIIPILDSLINAKTIHLFNDEINYTMARWYIVMKKWWMRGLMQEHSATYVSKVVEFRKLLRWNHIECDEKWIDREGVSLLIYAVCYNNVELVREILTELPKNILDSKLNSNGFVQVGVFGHATALMLAMSTSSSEIVTMLLEAGASTVLTDVNGSCGLMYAASSGRPTNITLWLDRVSSWDVNRKNSLVGSTALHCSVFFGVNKMETTRVLIERGANLFLRSNSGASVLGNAVSNEDCEPELIEYLFGELKKSNISRELGYQRRATTLKWKTIHLIALSLVKSGIAKSGVMNMLALDCGTTALHGAIKRGDLEIVKILIENGADVRTKNSLGMDAFLCCERLGPFLDIQRFLWRNEFGISKQTSEDFTQQRNFDFVS